MSNPVEQTKHANEEAYDFDEQNKLEEKWAPIIEKWLKKLFNRDVVDVRNKHLEYDFKVGDITFDLKTDTIMCCTGNFFLETESIKGKKPGWLYNKTDFIVYVDVVNKKPYLLSLELLRSHEDEIKTYPYHEVKNKGWTTCGHVVPIDVVLKWNSRFLDELKKKMKTKKVRCSACLKLKNEEKMIIVLTPYKYYFCNFSCLAEWIDTLRGKSFLSENEKTKTADREKG